MNQGNLDHIRQITGSVDINSQKEILLNGKTVNKISDDTYAKEPSGKMLFDELQKIIYQNFYIRPCEPLTQDLPTTDSLKENIAKLSIANEGTDYFDEGWNVDINEEGNALIACKGNNRIQLKPGEFLNVHSGNSGNAHKREVRIFRPKEQADTNDIFYFAYGTAIGDSNEDFIVRFYINASFEGNRKITQLITSFLNEFNVPFIFKCLIHPFYYGRSDTAVLYVNKQYANFTCNYLESIYPVIKDCLRDSLPLFIYPVKKGIGFAEQPPAESESFGSHWAKIIAAGIMKAYENSFPKEKWTEEVLKHIQVNHGYADLTCLYKNPQSHYPYSFTGS
jgi:hypothetical protein